MKVLVIVVTYNPNKWIDRCFGSLRKSNHKVDVFVVDNNSTDGSVDDIKRKYPEVIIYSSKVNLGFGQANNIGMRYALDNAYDYVYLLNQDAWILPNTLDAMITAAEHNKEYGILSPIQMEKDEKTYEYVFYKYVVCSDNLRCSFHRSLFNRSVLEDVYEISFVMAAHWLISRRCLETVGGFSPTFFHYGEDNNYVHRLFFHGFKLGIVSQAKAVHDSGYESKKKLRDTKHYRILNSELVYLSDPNRVYTAWTSVKSMMLKCFIEKDLIYLKDAWILLKNRNKILSNRKISINGTCFL